MFALKTPAKPTKPAAGSGDAIEDADWELYEEYVWPTIATRIPCLEAAKAIRGWAGYYEAAPRGGSPATCDAPLFFRDFLRNSRKMRVQFCEFSLKYGCKT